MNATLGSVVPLAMFCHMCQAVFSNWTFQIMKNHEKQPFYICCKLSKSVVTLSLLKIYVFSPPGYELCLLQPEKLPTLAKKVPSSQFDINTAVEVGKFLVEAVDTLTCPLFEESRWSTKMDHLGILQIFP